VAVRPPWRGREAARKAGGPLIPHLSKQEATQWEPYPPAPERWASAQTRLVEAFGTQSEEECRYVQWLMSFLVPRELDLYSAMIERRLTPPAELIGGLSYLAYNRTLTAPDALRRLRGTLREYEGRFDDPEDTDA
jgi:hypothetical protein